MNHVDRQGWDEDRVITVEREEYTVYCTEDAVGEVFLGDTKIGEVPARYPNGRRHNAPFRFDIVFHNTLPKEGTMEPLAEEVGDTLDEMFTQEVDRIFDEINSADNPLEKIIEMDRSDLAFD